MLYYGDRAREVPPSALVRRIQGRLRAAAATSGDAREEQLLAALLDCGELAQGLGDAAYDRAGHDAGDAAADATLAFAVEVARAWLGAAPLPGAAALASLHLPATVRTRVPEGYAHYALHPWCYVAAARALALPRAPAVVGLRSIGTSLAAVVAAVTRAALVATVRPGGHPYRRRLAVAGALAARLRGAIAAGRPVLVVDEGPGLSGSSFEAAAAWLAQAGASPDQVAFLPAHLGPLGPAASPEARARWEATTRSAGSFEDAVLPRLRAALAGRFGAVGLEDVSGGRWRAHVGAAGWPPVFAQQERRKYLLATPRGTFLARFAGLGRHGEEALERARALAAGGATPPPHGLVHGFLVEPWLEGARLGWAPARPGSRRGEGARALVTRLAADLALRARELPAGDGATAEELLEVVRVNAAEALGARASAPAWLAAGARQAAQLPRVAVDGKLEAWEWIARPDGTLVKADAVDHAHSHDLAGCQPAAWDVVGARVELGLADDAALELARRAAPGDPPAALAFLEAAYLAHRVGRWSFAAQVERDAAERRRIARALAHHRRLLRRVLASGGRRWS